ncbi:esterase/lipase family protein [Streptomyces lavendofoliae]|uniref:esterase/lipase family protein n=1 Tax=Streptomyces lavendofoliae TaxID=67314 RepID=UPI003D89F320
MPIFPRFSRARARRDATTARRWRRLGAATLTAGALASTLTALPSTSAAAAYAFEHRPIVFVHGWHSGASTWDSMVRYAHREGYGLEELVPFDYSEMSNPGRSVPIEDIARELRDFIADKRLAEKSPDGTVDIVAHSMGSLVARQYMKFEGGVDKVNHYVSLAGPNHGTALAENNIGLKIGDEILKLIEQVSGRQFSEHCDFQCRQMARDSKFLRRLNEGDETPRSDIRQGLPQYTTFRSNVGKEPLGYTNSRHVFPPALGLCDETVFGVSRDGAPVLSPREGLADTTALGGAENYTTGCLRHTEIPDDQWTQEQVLDILAAPTGQDFETVPVRRTTPRERAYTRCNELEPVGARGDEVGTRAWVQTCLRVLPGYHQVAPEVRVRDCGHLAPIADSKLWYYAPEAFGDSVPCTVQGAYTLHHPKGVTDGTLGAALNTRAGVTTGMAVSGGHGTYELTWRKRRLTVNQSGEPFMAADYARNVSVVTACSSLMPDPQCRLRPLQQH